MSSENVNFPLESALSYAHSLAWQEGSQDKMLELYANMDGISPDLEFNPLKHMIEAVNEHMCSSCMYEDNRFRDEFFLSLFKGYINYLFFYYGRKVPVTTIIAKRVHEYGHNWEHVSVLASSGDDEVEVNGFNRELFFDDNSNTKLFLYYNEV